MHVHVIMHDEAMLVQAVREIPQEHYFGRRVREGVRPVGVHFEVFHKFEKRDNEVLRCDW